MKTTKIAENAYFIQLEGEELEKHSFMYEMGLTCPDREAIELEGEDKYESKYLQGLLRAHESGCDRCKADYEALYASGMLNGEKPDHTK